METLTGTITGIRFQNDAGWVVAEIETGADPVADIIDPPVVVGVMPGLIQGLTVNLAGEWRDHPRYGRQFNVQSYQTEQPTSGDTLEIYLENVVPNVGPVLAQRIVARYGTATTEVMTDPRALQEIDGIGPERAKAIVDAWLAHEHERKALEAILAWLVQHELSTAYARKLFDAYGFGTLDVVNQDPYVLTELPGIGFKRADAIAIHAGMAVDAPERVRAALVYCLHQAAGEGHCYLPRTDLVTATGELLGSVDAQVTREALAQAARGDRPAIVIHGECAYLPSLHKAEREAAQHLARLATGDSRLTTFRIWAEADILAAMPATLAYTDEQQAAVVRALTHPVSTITGGPGTGKTTIVQAIVSLARDSGYTVVLAAPTGKAAKRLSQSAGVEAATLHRTLGVSGVFPHNADRPLSGDLFIVDEASMLDISLAAAFVRALPDGAHLVLVGDVDQLPAVGPGNVLQDIIASQIGPVTRLTKIWRQSEDSYIVPNAHAINHGEMPAFASGPGSDFYLFPAEDATGAANTILDLVTARIPKVFGFAAGDIQVLTPQKRTDAGVMALNLRLQAALNPPDPNKAEIALGTGPTARVLRVGDRVIQTENDYDKGVFNGDSGTIVRIAREDGALRLWVDIDGQLYEYDREDMSQLWHCWALTVHKAQGSEFPVVVMPVLTDHYVMLQRNLLYTGVTRASRLVVLVGNRRAIGIALANAKVRQRNTALTLWAKAEYAIRSSEE